MQVTFNEGFEVIEDGASYTVPQYDVVQDIGILDCGEPLEIRFVRGSKLPEDDISLRRGTLHEHLLAMMIHDLSFKAGLVPSRESALAITKLEEALHWLRQRSIDRAIRGVQGTYNK